MTKLPQSCSQWRLIDIGLNLTDHMYKGVYNGHQKHTSDIESILQRAVQVGVHGLLLTGGNYKESKAVIDMCARYTSDTLQCFCTVGCHPTRCQEFLEDPDGYLKALDDLILKHSVHVGGCVAAVGEIGLDYDRLSFCPKEVQKAYFEKQLVMAKRHRLPLFLHERNTAGDFKTLLEPHLPEIAGGVVHSFTGTRSELQGYLDAKLYIGVNGCSLKTAENIETVKTIPLDRLMLETDAPWCEVKGTHASKALLAAAAKRSSLQQSVSEAILAVFPTCRKEKFKEGCVVKGRNEPCTIVQILEVVYELRRDEVSSMEELADVIFTTTRKLFPFCGI
ncbi:tatd related deoxyribonuclease, putative [Leishmania tarentolae]|uniref:Tatd related deoxyribonuclease, putative n=1 Tax=Leishmania tarentolae TaxID=5689 RepID=A0A640KCG0_LEITA|nr:tatd related deoxyribonuclease, putative [Leishmania tarentolae]